MNRPPPSTISLQNYGTQNMSPLPKTQNAPNYFDNQTYSLFGDPVPPPVHPDEYLENIDNIYGRFRHNSNASSIMNDFPNPDGRFRHNSNASSIMTDFPKPDIFVQIKNEKPRHGMRLFPENPKDHDLYTVSGNPNLVGSHVGPDIRILPDSDSGSDVRSPRSIATHRDSNLSQQDVSRIRNESEKRKYSDYGEDFTGNYENSRKRNDASIKPKRIFSSEPMKYMRKDSNESYSSTDWFKPSHDYEEFTKIPKLRPSSKNVMSINQHESQIDSPVATLLNDYGENSSEGATDELIQTLQPQKLLTDGEHFVNNREHELGLPVDHHNLSVHGLPPTGIPNIKRETSSVIVTNVISTGADYRISPPRSHKKPSFIIIAENSTPSSRPHSASQLQNNHQQNLNENLHSSTGRVSPFLGRGFKENSKLQTSQIPNALPAVHLKLPVISNRNINPNNRNTSDESSRPSVQFDVSMDGRGKDISFQPTSKLISQSKHLRRPISAIQPPISQNQKVRSFETLPKITGLSGGNLVTRTPSRKLSKSSADLHQESRSASAVAVRSHQARKNPTSRQKGVLRVINSANSSPSRIPVQLKWVQDSLDYSATQKSALLRNYRRRSTSPERRSSSQTEPRSSIDSIRRSSNLSSVTTSDFSFRRNSSSPIRRNSITSIGDTNKHKKTAGRNQSPLQTNSKFSKKPRAESNSQYLNLSANKNTSYSSRKVAKPTTLSPIIGTPNKDGPLTPEEIENSTKFISSIDKNDSITKIPVMNGSNVTSRSESRAQSRAESRAGSRGNSRAPTAVNSRSSSPQKDFTPYSRPNSRAESKSSTRVSSRSNSRAESLSRPISRVASDFNVKSPSKAGTKRPSRPKSRTSSNLDQKQNVASKSSSKSNSSKSRKSPVKDRRKSISNTRSSSPKKPRRKSESPKKPVDNSRSRSRGRSTSSKTTKKIAKVESKSKIPSPKKSQGTNRSNSNRTSSHKEQTSAKKSSSGKSTVTSSKSSSSTVNKGKNLKNEGSNLSRSTSNLKKSSAKTDKSPVKKTNSNIKREPSKISLKNDNSAIKREPSNLKQSDRPVEPTSEQHLLSREPSRLKLNTDKLKRVPSLIKLRTNSNLSKKLEKKGSSKNLVETDNATTADNMKTLEENASSTNMDANNTLIPLTKANVVSMTTAAITAQPVQITTALTNQLHKNNSSGQLVTSNLDPTTDDMSIPVAILEKSQKTLENIQKTVTEATDEIQKTINDNLTDLKTLENDIGKIGSDMPPPLEKSDSKKSLKEKSGTNNLPNDKVKNNNEESAVPSLQPVEASVSIVPGNNLSTNQSDANHKMPNEGLSEGLQVAEDMAERVSERAISVLPYVDCEDANLQNYEQHHVDGEDAVTIGQDGNMNKSDELMANAPSGDNNDKTIDDSNNNLRSDSQEYLDEEQATGCCGRSRCSKCCSRFCMPCRRCRGSKCCKKKNVEDTETASVIVKEVDEKPVTKTSCWQRMKCCKGKSSTIVEEHIEQRHMETINEEPDIMNSSMSSSMPKQSKCGMCLSKIFCCRATNKVEATTIDAEPVKKCCFCIPCKRKNSTSTAETAWQVPPPETSAERRESILSAPVIPPESRCTRFMNKLKFWKKKDPSRRASMGSRKQSLAPTNPPEDTRPKLHNDLVDYNSKMKAAIPVLPIYLAYFCTGCNIIIPGLGTILSGIFCICVGIPRFSQYDSAKARLGSFVINCFVGIAQFFCVIFCFVGWGWSMWWGSIMMKTARKLQKIRKVEKLELEEEQRQAVLNAQAAAEKKAAEEGTGTAATTTKA